MSKPYKLITVGLVTLVIIVSTVLTSTSWASEGLGFIIVMVFPALLIGVTVPLTVGGIGLFHGQSSADIRNLDLAVAGAVFLLVGLIICYVIFYAAV